MSKAAQGGTEAKKRKPPKRTQAQRWIMAGYAAANAHADRIAQTERRVIEQAIAFIDDAPATGSGLTRRGELAEAVYALKEALGPDGEFCSKGGEHVWGTDGQHSNEFCKRCFVSKPAAGRGGANG